MNKEQRVARGIRAKLLLDSDDIIQAFADAETDITDEWKASLTWWGQIRKWHELRGLHRVKARLAGYASEAPRN